MRQKQLEIDCNFQQGILVVTIESMLAKTRNGHGDGKKCQKMIEVGDTSICRKLRSADLDLQLSLLCPFSNQKVMKKVKKSEKSHVQKNFCKLPRLCP